ncbi:MAG: HyaD/HybD family hydrogenase maturation endopeptidase [Pseudomonadota bacterium]
MSTPHTLVLGVGNILWADEGFGVRAVEALERRYHSGPEVELMDGGTRGLALLEPIGAADRLLLLDAVAFGGRPGEIRRVAGDDVPRFVGQKAMSLHQTGMQDILALADLQGVLPRHLVLLGVEPALLEDYGGGLSPAVATTLDEAVALAVIELQAWGHMVLPRARPLDAASVNVEALQHRPYETGRPAAEAACRIGDDRFLRQVG